MSMATLTVKHSPKPPVKMERRSEVFSFNMTDGEKNGEVDIQIIYINQEQDGKSHNGFNAFAMTGAEYVDTESLGAELLNEITFIGFGMDDAIDLRDQAVLAILEWLKANGMGEVR